MPIPVRKPMIEDEIVPRHLNARRSALREGPHAPNFVPRRPSPLTTRPFSSAFDDDFELSPHVPVPLDPQRGVATVPEKHRRTPRSPYGMLDTGSGYFPHYESESESRRREAPPSAPPSQDSHENASSSTSHSSTFQPVRRERSRQRLSSMDSMEAPKLPPHLLSPEPRLKRPSSFAELRNRASMIMSGSHSSSSSSSSLHSPHPMDMEKPSRSQVSLNDVVVEVEDSRPRRNSIAKLVLNVFRPKTKHSRSLSIEVSKTTRVTKVEQATFRRYE